VPGLLVESALSRLGRDIARSKTGTLLYLVGDTDVDDCANPTLVFFAYGADLVSTREIAKHLPFRDPRPKVCYFRPGVASQIAHVRALHPASVETMIRDGAGAVAFTRVEVR